MFKYLLRFFSRLESERRIKNIFKRGKFDTYKQERIREIAVSVVYDASRRLWASNLHERHVGAILLEIGQNVKKHQREFDEGIKEIFDSYQKLRGIGQGNPLEVVEQVQVLQTEQERALKKEVEQLLKDALNQQISSVRGSK